MDEDGAAPESIATVTGGSKPVHRFLRGQPKSNGVSLIVHGVCLFVFGIPTTYLAMTTPVEILSPIWLGVLFSICGLLYILSEQNPSKKIITASFAMSIISIIGVFVACVDLFISIGRIRIGQNFSYYHTQYNFTKMERHYFDQHCDILVCMVCVFLGESLVVGIMLVVMACFARAGLRSSNTQAIVVMRNLPSAE